MPWLNCPTRITGGRCSLFLISFWPAKIKLPPGIRVHDSYAAVFRRLGGRQDDNSFKPELLWFGRRTCGSRACLFSEAHFMRDQIAARQLGVDHEAVAHF